MLRFYGADNEKSLEEGRFAAPPKYLRNKLSDQFSSESQKEENGQFLQVRIVV